MHAILEHVQTNGNSNIRENPLFSCKTRLNEQPRKERATAAPTHKKVDERFHRYINVYRRGFKLSRLQLQPSAAARRERLGGCSAAGHAAHLLGLEASEGHVRQGRSGLRAHRVQATRSFQTYTLKQIYDLYDGMHVLDQFVHI